MGLKFVVRADVEVEGMTADEAENVLYEMFETDELCLFQSARFDFTDVDIELIDEGEEEEND